MAVTSYRRWSRLTYLSRSRPSVGASLWPRAAGVGSRLTASWGETVLSLRPVLARNAAIAEGDHQLAQAAGTAVGAGDGTTGALVAPASSRHGMPLPSQPAARFHREIITDRATWDGWVAEADRGSFLQSFEWGELKSRFGWEPVRLAVLSRDRLVAGAQVLFRQLPFGTLAYVPRGPIINGDEPTAWRHLLAGLHQVAQDRRAFCLKIEPAEVSSPGLAAGLIELGGRLAPSIQPRSTLVVDLSAGPAATWNQLAAGTRYNVRLAARRGVTVEERGRAGLADFYRLLEQTSQRASFAVHDAAYYSAAWETLGEHHLARLYTACHEGEILAAALVLRIGDRAYHAYAASSTLGRRLKPNDFLLWESIRRAQTEGGSSSSSQGCASYDLWGIPDQVGRAVENGEEPSDTGEGDLWGVYQFKRGFGGRVVRHVGAYDWVYSASRYWLWRTLQPGARELKARAWRKHEAGRASDTPAESAADRDPAK